MAAPEKEEKGFSASHYVKKLLDKSTMALVVAAFIVIASMCYFLWIGDSERIAWYGAFGAGWLFKTLEKKEGK